MSQSLMAEHHLCDQRARAALEAEEWAKALEQLERAQALLHAALSADQENNTLPLVAHARLVHAVLGSLHPRLVAGDTGGIGRERRAELCWRLQGLLKRHGELPLERPDWLPVAEEQLVRHGALLWREAVGAQEQAGERARAMLRRLAQLLDPCPAWVSTSLRELESGGPVRLEPVLRPGQEQVITADGQRLSNAVPALEGGDQPPPLPGLARSLRERASAGSPGVAIGQPLSSLRRNLAVLGPLREEPQQRPVPWLEGAAAVIELDALELAVLQLAALGPEPRLAAALQELELRRRDLGFWRAGERRRDWWRSPLEPVDVLRRFAREQGFYGPRENPLASLRAWCEQGLSLMAEALRRERAQLWSEGEAANRLLLPLQQAICRSSASATVVGGRPELEALQELLAGEEVLYLGPFAESVEAQWRQGRCWRLWQGREVPLHNLRCVALPESRYPRRPHAGFQASLAHTVEAVERLLQERPAGVAVIGPGVYRLPLLLALRQRHGLRCLAFGSGVAQLYGVELPGEPALWGAEGRESSQWCRLEGEW